MIFDLIDALCGQRVIDPRNTPYFANYQRHLKIFFCPGEGSGVFVKISAGPEARCEYLSLKRFQDRLTGHVPSPLALVERNGQCALACSMLRHGGVRARDILDGRLTAQLSLVFRSMRECAGPCDWRRPAQLGEILAHFQDRMGVDDFPPWSLPYMQDAAREVESDLPRIPQHGDMLAINLGIDSGRLVVFDWEDYGILELCGCDLATLLFSAMSALKRRSAPLLHPQDLYSALEIPCISDLLTQTGVAKKTFLRCFPYYLFAFLYLKRRLGYGEEIANTVSSFLKVTFASHEWKSCLGC